MEDLKMDIKNNSVYIFPDRASMDIQVDDPPPYFFTFLSIRAGSAVSSVITAALMITAMLHIPLTDNDLIESKYKAVQYVVAYSYLITNLVANTVIIISVGTVNVKHLKCGLYLTMLCCFYWMVVTVIGYIAKNDMFRFVCFENNCPEVHWLFDTKWRNYGIKCPFQMTYPNGTQNLEKENGLEKQRVILSPFENFNATWNVEELGSKYMGCEKYSSGPMATSTLLGLFWLLFTVYMIRTIKKLEEMILWEKTKL